MNIFLPDCYADDTLQSWLMPATLALLVAGVTLLVQMSMLWRRLARAGISWWARLPQALPGMWACACWLVVARVVAWIFLPIWFPPERLALGQFNLPGPPAPIAPPCLSAASLQREVAYTFFVASVMLILGWRALSRLAQRADAA
jgi:hypothetical protein